MNFIELNFDVIDWKLIRQALSFSLMKNKKICIKRGSAFLNENDEYTPLFRDIENSLKVLDAGFLGFEGDSIIFDPRPLSYGRHEIQTGVYSSFIDLFLFFMPSLFLKEFRSVLTLKGVSHCHLSYPTPFIKESFLPFLEQAGFYASLNLERFGFYGSGGGRAEARIYPVEKKKADFSYKPDNIGLRGAKIFISKTNPALGQREKELIMDSLGIPEKKIVIIEIRDSDGYGNSVQVFTGSENTDTSEQNETDVPLDMVFFREMKIYNHAGDFIFDEENFNNELNSLFAETDKFLKTGMLPDSLLRELIPYYYISGGNISSMPDSPMIDLTKELCKKIIG